METVVIGAPSFPVVGPFGPRSIGPETLSDSTEGTYLRRGCKDSNSLKIRMRAWKRSEPMGTRDGKENTIETFTEILQIRNIASSLPGHCQVYGGTFLSYRVEGRSIGRRPSLCTLTV